MNRTAIRMGIFLLHAISRTWRIKIHGEIPDGNFIAAFWHGSMLPGWFAFRKRNPVAIVSRSGDGEILSSLLNKWGVETLRGSSNEGGREVLEQAVEAGKNRVVLVTPDGPKGPPRRMKAGAFKIAQRTGRPLLLISMESGKKIIFKKSWDKFELPLPFTRIDVIIKETISIPWTARRDDIELLIAKSEALLS